MGSGFFHMSGADPGMHGRPNALAVSTHEVTSPGNSSAIGSSNRVRGDQSSSRVRTPASLPPGAPNGQDGVVRLNVSGQRFETYWSTLGQFPNTRLGTLSLDDANCNQETKEFFFDRHSGVFQSVLYMYQTGELHYPRHYCANLLDAELKYWGLEPDGRLQDCCWADFVTTRDQKLLLAEFETDFQESLGTMPLTPRNRLQCVQKAIWTFLDDSCSSRAAAGFAFFSVIIILLSIAVFCLETQPEFKGSLSDEEWYHYYGIPHHEREFVRLVDHVNATQNGTNGKMVNSRNVTGSSATSGLAWGNFTSTNSTGRIIRLLPKEEHVARIVHPALYMANVCCQLYFTFEFLLRLLCAPNKLKHLRSVYTIGDLVALLPFYIQYLLIYLEPKEHYEDNVWDFLGFIQVTRLLRLFRLLRNYESLQVFAYTIRASIKEIGLLLIFLCVSIVIYSSLIFYAEKHVGTFSSIPDSFWWAVITLTTVGFGDVVPRTPLGHAVGGMCAVSGVLVIAFTVPIIVNNFMMYYSYFQSVRHKRPGRRVSGSIGEAPNCNPDQHELLSVVVNDCRATTDSDSPSINKGPTCCRRFVNRQPVPPAPANVNGKPAEETVPLTSMRDVNS